ncbi:MAG: DUF1565 domain-containing protein, partial [Flavobacteriales bacterium]|nr:DUF1565 domain-containing protein [Flavobacteriales bacterium]
MKNFLIATALILTTYLTTAQTIYVDADATEWLGDGLSWQTAFANLHEALAAATDGDEIWVAEGTYYPSSTDNPLEFFEVPAGVSIYGGFKGDELIRSQRDWSKYPTIISGEIGTSAHNDNSNNLLSVMGENVAINGLVLQESYFDPTASSTYASSAIYVDISGSVVVNNCRFFDCVSRSGTAIKGGAYSSITMNNCLIENNTINEGNMVTSDIDGSVTIRHCT